jgi:hypothetical protein
MLRKTRNLTLALLPLLLAGQVHAQQYCTTTVSNLYVAKDGSVIVNAAIRGDYLQLCNLNADWKGVSPMTCAAWHTLTRSAVTRKSTMTLYYAETTPCNLIPYYGNAPSPYYVMMAD